MSFFGIVLLINAIWPRWPASRSSQHASYWNCMRSPDRSRGCCASAPCTGRSARVRLPASPSRSPRSDRLADFIGDAVGRHRAPVGFPFELEHGSPHQFAARAAVAATSWSPCRTSTTPSGGSAHRALSSFVGVSYSAAVAPLVVPRSVRRSWFRRRPSPRAGRAGVRCLPAPRSSPRVVRPRPSATFPPAVVQCPPWLRRGRAPAVSGFGFIRSVSLAHHNTLIRKSAV